MLLLLALSFVLLASAISVKPASEGGQKAFVNALAIAAPQDGFCSVCEALVGFVEAYLEQNATIAEIEAQLDTICALAGPYSSECQQLVAQYTPQIIKWVEKNESPQQICTQLNVCTNNAAAANAVAALLNVQRPAVAAPQDNGFCSVCEAIVGFVESYLEQNATIAQIEARLDALCALAGPYSSQCQALVNAYLPQIIQWLEKNETPQDICSQLGVCMNNVAVSAPRNQLECTICTTLVGYVEVFVAQNATEQQIEKALKKICAVIKPIEQVCDDLVDNYLPQIIADVLKNETPDKVCQKLKLCDNSTTLAIAAAFKTQLTAAASNAVAAVAAPQDNGFCSVCEAIVGFVESYLEQNATIAQIEARLDALCALAGPYSSQCQALVNAYLPQIIQWLEKNETPQDICSQLGVCMNQAVTRVAASGTGCFLCKNLVGYVELFLQNNATEQQIEAKLKKLCKVAGPLESVCDDLVDNELPTIIADLENNFTPTKVCDEIKLCDNGTVVAAKAVAAPQDNGFCSVCEAIVGFVESYLEQNATIAQIEARLDALCALAGPYSSQCQALVDAYLPQIIKWLEKNETPEDICTQLMVCTNTAATSVKAQLKTQLLALPSAKANAELCAVCEAIVALGDHYVATNQTESYIETQLEKACALAGQYESICDGIVEAYTDDLAMYIARKATPKTVCDDLLACDSK